MAVGDTIRVVCNGFIQNRPCSNVFHYIETQEASGTDFEQMAECGETFVADWIAHMLDVQSVDYLFVSASCGRIHPTDGINVTTYAPLETTGTITADAVPELAAAVISLSTTEAGKSGRGRIYLPGIPQIWADGGILIGSNMSQIATAFTQMRLLAGATGEWSLGVFSRLLNQSFSVMDFQVRPPLGTQRRRRPRNAPPAVEESPP